LFQKGKEYATNAWRACVGEIKKTIISRSFVLTKNEEKK
jgi:hypothetical protein